MIGQADLIVVGGGINGVAIALDAVMRGLQVVLIEQHTVGSGTSSKTSKLAHGGLRYLEQFQFGVVRESLAERNLLLMHYPQFVHPMPFVIPVYASGPWSRLKLACGLWVYDLLSLRSPMPRHHYLSAVEVQTLCPGISGEGLRGGFVYYDAQMDDLGLLEHLCDRAKAFGVVVLEHTQCRALQYDSGRVSGVEVVSHGEVKTISAAVVLQATGPWSTMLLGQDDSGFSTGVLPSKGVHLVLPALPFLEALLLSAPQDQRVFFVIPWKGFTLVGTTETLYSGSPDQVDVEAADRAYLLEAYNYYFPEYHRQETDIISEFAGLRPLLYTDGAKDPGKVSRDFALLESTSGLLSLVGGKYTTHRYVAEHVVDTIVAKLGRDFGPCLTRDGV